MSSYDDSNAKISDVWRRGFSHRTVDTNRGDAQPVPEESDTCDKECDDGRMDISHERWRVYVNPIAHQVDGFVYTKIKRPLFLWRGETSHRVQDISGLVTCVHVDQLTVIHWSPKDPSRPVAF